MMSAKSGEKKAGPSGPRPWRGRSAAGLSAAASAVAFLALAVVSPAAAQKAERVKSFGAWHAHVYEIAGRKVCFISARARKRMPKTLKRRFVGAYVASWSAAPGKKARDREVSVRLGYPLQAGNSVSLLIDGRRFSLFAEGENAFVGKRAQEKQVLAAMGRGRKMLVEARTADGQNIRDSYSLKGSGKALKFLRTICK